MLRRCAAKAVLASLLMLCLTFSASFGETKTFGISELELIAYNSLENGRGEVVVLSWVPPSSLRNRKIFSAFLEFYVELDSQTESEYSGVPVVDVRELNSLYTGSGPLDAIESSATVASSVDPGSGRLRVDIRGLLVRWLEDPESNRGLAIGNIGNANVTNIRLKTTEYAPGTAGRLVVRCR